MKYALIIGDNERILSVTSEKFAPNTEEFIDTLPDGSIKKYKYVLVDEFPKGNVYEYRYVDGEFIHDPIVIADVKKVPTAQDDIDAMLVDHEYRLTMLELGITE